MASSGEHMHVLVEIDERADDRRVAATTRMLARELARAHVRVDFDSADSDAPPGSKSSTAMMIGSLLVSGTLSAATLQQVAKVLIAFIQRGSARRVTIKDGKHEITFDAVSDKSQRKLIDAWIEARSKKE